MKKAKMVKVPAEYLVALEAVLEATDDMMPIKMQTNGKCTAAIRKASELRGFYRPELDAIRDAKKGGEVA